MLTAEGAEKGFCETLSLPSDVVRLHHTPGLAPKTLQPPASPHTLLASPIGGILLARSFNSSAAATPGGAFVCAAGVEIAYGEGQDRHQGRP